MKEFFAKTGNHKLRFKPAFNPYTEPSMEVFSWHEGLGKWIEIANVSAAARPDTGARAGRPEPSAPLSDPTQVREGRCETKLASENFQLTTSPVSSVPRCSSRWASRRACASSAGACH